MTTDNERRAKNAADIQLFVKKYARKKGRNGMDPNDRDYDRAVESRVKRMRPEDLDALLRDGEDEGTTESSANGK